LKFGFLLKLIYPALVILALLILSIDFPLQLLKVIDDLGVDSTGKKAEVEGSHVDRKRPKTVNLEAFKGSIFPFILKTSKASRVS
jgi:hypothetical protein